MSESTVEPELVRASSLDPHDVGHREWNREHNPEDLSFSDDGLTVAWEPKNVKPSGGYGRAAWVPASTRLRLHSGHYRWDFVIEELGRAQIGVGFMLQWNLGLDWGFYGYLGAGPSAWAYDPLTGNVVNATKSIEGGLAKFEDGRRGTVTVYLDVPREAPGHGRFRVSGVDSGPIALPPGAVVVPAACLHEPRQRVTLAGFERSRVDA